MSTIEGLGALAALGAFRHELNAGVRCPVSVRHLEAPSGSEVPVPELSSKEQAKVRLLPGSKGEVREPPLPLKRKPVAKVREQMSFEDYAAMLRKVNLIIDMFEIQAKFHVDLETGRVTVEIVNQHTGELIRKIPPYELPGILEALEKGKSESSLLVEVEA